MATVGVAITSFLVTMEMQPRACIQYTRHSSTQLNLINTVRSFRLQLTVPQTRVGLYQYVKGACMLYYHKVHSIKTHTPIVLPVLNYITVTATQ